MAVQEKQKKTYTPSISYGGEVLEYKDAPLAITTTEPYKCIHCSEDITIKQIKDVVSGIDETVAKKVLVKLNKYKKEGKFKLDNCLRKAHFITQVASETQFSSMKESGYYPYGRLQRLSNFTVTPQTINSTILTSLEKHLSEIFEIRDKNDKKLSKTNSQIKQIVKDASITYDIREMYGYRRDKKKKYLPEKNIKEVMETVKNAKGDEIEQIKYKIIIKKRTKAYSLEILSRAYASRMNNGNELSRDGYKFSGKGIKQLTGKNNYTNFTNRRKALGFPDYDKHIDFTVTTNSSTLEGNYDKLADKDNVTYGVQAAIWYWLEGNGKIYSYSDDDNVAEVSYRINGGWNGFADGDYPRKKGILKARKAFKVYDHYKLVHENGTQAEKDKVIEILSRISKKHSKRGKTIEKDPEAEKLLKELRTVKLVELKPMPMETIELKFDIPKLQPVPVTATTSSKSKKKRKKKRK
ncbi:hypothetical protein [Aquimarina algiphila]|uniref:hypothetical protein n=1 Tax=Aquimarina algiphila TaxID=2047982 RepID=UPI00232F52BB|nr:hypothetical protein [Aquimarina algiphila]